VHLYADDRIIGRAVAARSPLAWWAALA